MIPSEWLKIFAGTALMTLVTLGLGLVCENLYIKLALQVVGGACVYFIALMIIKESIVTEYYGKFKKKVVR